VRLVLALAFAALLTAAEPKIDLNAATASQLQALPGIGPATAERIVRIRDRNGPYRCVEEMRAVPRLTDAQYHILEERVFVTRGGAGTRPPHGGVQGALENAAKEPQAAACGLGLAGQRRAGLPSKSQRSRLRLRSAISVALHTF
jgi:competence ComEA-like helix-hairpin-helix protein